MRACTSPIQAWKSTSAAPICLALGRFGHFLERLQHLAFEHLYLLLRAFEPLLAETGELEPALVGGKCLFQRQVPAFHARDDFFQLGEGLLETELGAR